MGDQVFKLRLACSVAVLIAAGLKQLCTAVKNFIANVLKCKTQYLNVYVFVSDESVLM